jgi:hypothetical protein
MLANTVGSTGVRICICTGGKTGWAGMLVDAMDLLSVASSHPRGSWGFAALALALIAHANMLPMKTRRPLIGMCSCPVE